MRDGDYLEALRFLYQAQKLDPDNAQVARMVDRAMAELQKKAPMQSLSFVVDQRIGPAEKEKSHDLYMKGLILYSKGQLKEAQAMWEESLKINPFDSLAKQAKERIAAELSQE